ncbi:SWIM zinc finger family protein [Amycolatopsis rhabdoformis]|uniref:SWIM zinc finger family protein n=1 Tax=Amycolatopsis rhabdoformis TaxID=1448059 RepID=A0ABZ1IGX6_9PSEU|nr:SWIM zinc finger family protein [Amycolatopsis rhabdoformis]WSE33011.1 SWIM zinc finger family protein [Amycolatopsis rhabdoformis]
MTDRVQGFPAFPAREGRGPFARTWWGRAWLRAMEDTALDLRQLRRGRRYAVAGLVGPISVSPGRIAATVDDVDGGPFRTSVHLAELSTADWERLIGRAADRAGNLAALLDRHLPPELADDVPLLPGIGDLDPECECPGFELPCRHAAALSFQVSWLLDADPFVLLLARGRTEREILHELGERTARPVEGILAADAYARAVPPLPDLADFSPVPR